MAGIEIYTCRCGRPVVVLTTRRGKRVGVNRTPYGPDGHKFQTVGRMEEYYQHGVHQLHFLTCTKPNPRRKTNARSNPRGRRT